MSIVAKMAEHQEELTELHFKLNQIINRDMLQETEEMMAMNKENERTRIGSIIDVLENQIDSIGALRHRFSSAIIRLGGLTPTSIEKGEKGNDKLVTTASLDTLQDQLERMNKLITMMVEDAERLDRLV